MARITHKDFLHTGPSTLAGRYLRQMFWHPVYIAEDLAPGRAVPIRIMGEDFTLYRGEDGTPHVVGFRCAHRGTQLSVGWVEGDCIRCFYHGWKYDSAGQCIEQPAEPTPFAEKIRIPSYPVREYLGLIFAYFGDGELPPFPRYLNYEDPESVTDAEVWLRPCNYFHNVENSVDPTHVAFVHQRHREQARDHGSPGLPEMSMEETDWGICHRNKYSNGAEFVFNYGMPYINYIYGQIADPDVKRVEMILWKVPADDYSHLQFEIHRLKPPTDEALRIWQRRKEQRAREASLHAPTITGLIEGKVHWDDLDPARIDFVSLEDDIAQAGQGVMWDRQNEHLGHGDLGVILLRKIWARELRALAEGRPLKQWIFRPEEMTPIYPEF